MRHVAFKPPLVPNANDAECVCPDGEVLRGGKYVELTKPKRTRVIETYGADKGLAQTMARLTDYVVAMASTKSA